MFRFLLDPTGRVYDWEGDEGVMYRPVTEWMREHTVLEIIPPRVSRLFTQAFRLIEQNHEPLVLRFWIFVERNGQAQRSRSILVPTSDGRIELSVHLDECVRMPLTDPYGELMLRHYLHEMTIDCLCTPATEAQKKECVELHAYRPILRETYGPP